MGLDLMNVHCRFCLLTEMSLDEFIQGSSGRGLDKCTKEQLLTIADYYKIEVLDRKSKVRIKLSGLIKQHVLPEDEFPTYDETEPEKYSKPSSRPSEHLTFEQQRELLFIKLDHEKEIERLKHNTEVLKLELEREKL